MILPPSEFINGEIEQKPALPREHSTLQEELIVAINPIAKANIC
jgi:hypothetical protein